MKAKRDRPKLPDVFKEAWAIHGLDGSDLTTELQFHPTRRWRFDIAFPSQKLAIELDGFGFGHQSIKQKRADHEKQNAATELGWRVLRYTSYELKPNMIEDTIEQVVRVLCGG